MFDLGRVIEKFLTTDNWTIESFFLKFPHLLSQFIFSWPEVVLIVGHDCSLARYGVERAILTFSFRHEISLGKMRCGVILGLVLLPLRHRPLFDCLLLFWLKFNRLST